MTGSSNVVRWEMRPRIFLRTTEFLWQEGHTCHATEAEARAHAREVLDDVYGACMTEVLAIPVVKGLKSARERFAGATNTLTCEAMMGDGKALQMGTSHELGQNFARAFDVQFLAASGRREYVWQTSWGVSTRMIGGLIMCHGDDAGLRVPPRLAPVQAIVLVVRDDADVRARAHQAVSELRDVGVRAVLDEQTDISFGRRAVDAELKGVPVRVELGPRELAEGKAVLVRRIPGTKEPVALAALVPEVEAALRTDQQALHDQALARREAASPLVGSLDQALEAAARGWARIPWSVLGVQGEARLIEHAVTVRCLTRPDGSVPDSGDETDLIAWVGRAY
ncbi:MAG: His/Gly/Thr/Pro-type tRNA ligase C-terminal domain-containing protein [Pseudonocardiaceae bacterium]